MFTVLALKEATVKKGKGKDRAASESYTIVPGKKKKKKGANHDEKQTALEDT